MARYEIRPLGVWTGPVTVPRQGSGRFRATWSSTLELLAREVEALDGGLIVLQIDVTEGELRRDGMLRSDAKVRFPGVRVGFGSRHGPLTYSTDAYESRYYSDPPGWQANIRAIALALGALRAVDRYGVSGRGEQYRGWTAIAAAPQLTAGQAAVLIAELGGSTYAVADILADSVVRAHAFKLAALKTHPDAGGDVDAFVRLTAARDLLVRGDADVA